tara:strand:- start:135 stop:773 length:639 start_codon:yes stop_codon:yes gene_type:complete
MNKKSFVLYTDMNGFIKAMSDEQAGTLIKMVYCYACDEEISKTSDTLVTATFNHIKIKMDECESKYAEKRRKASESANKRWHKNAMPKDANECERIQTQCDPMLNVTVTDTVKEKSKTKVLPKKVGSRFDMNKHVSEIWLDEALKIKPELEKEQVRLELAKFNDHWTSKTGKDATKLNWLATWRNWIRNGYTIKKPTNNRINEMKKFIEEGF